MKVVKQIFLDDLKHLAKNFFALVIAVGVCFLPALYAWFNIYSNWDPYGNTGALKIAAISLDKGYTNDGEYENVGEGVIENLHENTSVDWQFVETEEEAINGVYDGTYYAAVVIGEDFTYNMYNVFTEGASEPTLVFYQNQKKNPVATKISDTVVGTLEKNINEAFIEVVVNEVFSNVNEAYEIIEDQGGVDGALEKMDAIYAQLCQYQLIIDQTIAANNSLKVGLASAKTDTDSAAQKANNGGAEMDNAVKSLDAVSTSVKDYKKNVDDSMKEIVDILNKMDQTLKDNGDATIVAADMTEIAAKGKICQADYKLLKEQIDKLEKAGIFDDNSDPSNPKKIEGYTDFQKDMLELKAGIDGITNEATAGATTIGSISTTINTTIKAIEATQAAVSTVVLPAVDQSIASLQKVMAESANLMRSVGTTMSGLGKVFVSMDSTVSSANVSLEKTSEAIGHICDKMNEVLVKAHAASEDERMEIIINTLTGDPDVYGAFFAEPVEIESNTIFPVDNYGSAVTPFYTTLAVWVGGLILCAIIKVHPNKKNYPGATPAQLYFGRYALFFLCAQFQALIIVLGNLLVFKVQCVHPGWFWFAASVAATTFSLLIYSLVLSFGDVGKAIAVVVVVLQIAGSSGTYPIELLPEFFQKVYIFFPFPYSINAMRECTCGMYEADYLVYILKLSIFIIVALVIGLLVRVPFEELNHFFEERMEDTEMM